MNMDGFVYTNRFAHEAHIYWERHRKETISSGRKN